MVESEPTPTQIKQAPRLVFALLIGLVFLSAVRFGYSSIRVRDFGYEDIDIILRQDAEFRATGRLYPSADDLSAFAPNTEVYAYPPLMALLLLPVVDHEGPPGPSHWFYDLAFFLQLISYLAAGSLLTWYLLPRSQWGSYLVPTIVILNLEPFFETLLGLQLETLILLLLVVCLHALRRGKDWAAGSCLALATMLKIYPAFMLLPLLLRRRWHALGSFLATCGFVSLITVAVFGWENHAVFLFKLLPRMLRWLPTVGTGNVGLAKYVHYLGMDLPAANRVAQVLFLIVLLPSVVLVHRRRQMAPSSDQLATEFSLFVSLMLLGLANSWANYQLLLLCPLLVLAYHLARSEARWRWGGWVGLGLCCGWLTMTENVEIYTARAMPDLYWLAVVFRGVVTILCFGGLLGLLWKTPIHSHRG